jgi:cytochrome c-type biogenesis protein
MLITIGLSFAAGVLAALSPCVLPVLPLVVGSAARAHRAGPLALAAGLVATFTIVGVLLASLGARLPIDDALVRYASATLLALAGVIMMSARLHDRVSGAFTPLASAAARLSSRVGEGLAGQFAVGALLGGVWSPCVGPTLGAALGLAGESDSLIRAVLMLIAFGLGSATPLVATAYASRSVLSRRATLLRAGHAGQSILGGVLVLTAVLVWSGFDKVIEASVVEHLPSWWVAVLAKV